MTPNFRNLGVLAVLAGALALANLPYLYGYGIRPPGTRFWAVPPVNAGDANQYLALARQARDGRLLLRDPFTTEPHEPRLFLPLSLFEGAVCRLTGWTPIGAFQLSRVLAGAALLAAGWWFGTLLLRPWRLRWLYLGFLCLSAGAGWLFERAGLLIPNGDLLQPEGNTVFSLGNLPNVALASALLTYLFGALLYLDRSPATHSNRGGVPSLPGPLVPIVGASALLSWTHPFDFLSLGLGLGGYAVIRGRAGWKPCAAHAAAVGLGALPAAAYLFWLVRTDPFYRALASDTLRVQPFSYYAIAHGLLALPALIVLWHRPLRRRCALPLCWVMGVFLFLLTPFRLGGKQPRMVGGIHVPLAVLATVGTDFAACGLRRRRRQARSLAPSHPHTLTPSYSHAAVTFYLAITATGTWGMLNRHLREYSRRGPDYYQSPSVQTLYRVWAQESRPGEVTLGGPYTAGWAPTWADTTVFHGHWHMTLRQQDKAAEREWFYLRPADPALKGEWLRSRGITWVIWCPGEWRSEAPPPDGVPGLRRMCSASEVVLYRFEWAGSPQSTGPVPTTPAPGPTFVAPGTP